MVYQRYDITLVIDMMWQESQHLCVELLGEGRGQAETRGHLARGSLNTKPCVSSLGRPQ